MMSNNQRGKWMKKEDLELREYVVKRAREWSGENDLPDIWMYEKFRDTYIGKGWELQFRMDQLQKTVVGTFGLKKLPFFIKAIVKVLGLWRSRRR